MKEYRDLQTGDPLTGADLWARYDDMLDDFYPSVYVGEIKFRTSEAMKALTYDDYRNGFKAWYREETENGNIEYLGE